MLRHDTRLVGSIQSVRNYAVNFLKEYNVQFIWAGTSYNAHYIQSFQFIQDRSLSVCCSYTRIEHDFLKNRRPPHARDRSEELNDGSNDLDVVLVLPSIKDEGPFCVLPLKGSCEQVGSDKRNRTCFLRWVPDLQRGNQMNTHVPGRRSTTAVPQCYFHIQLWSKGRRRLLRETMKGGWKEPWRGTMDLLPDAKHPSFLWSLSLPLFPIASFLSAASPWRTYVLKLRIPDTTDGGPFLGTPDIWASIPTPASGSSSLSFAIAFTHMPNG